MFLIRDGVLRCHCCVFLIRDLVFEVSVLFLFVSVLIASVFNWRSGICVCSVCF